VFEVSNAYVECSYSGWRKISLTVTPFTHSRSKTLSLSWIYDANLSIPYVNSTATGFASNPPICWKYVNWVISIPSSHTSQPSPARSEERRVGKEYRRPRWRHH